MARERGRIAHRGPRQRRKLSGALGLGVALALTVLSLGGCSDTREVPLDVCGNGVLDPGEDCDGSADCTASCRYPCDAERACPAGFGCDIAQQVCRAASGAFQMQSSFSSGRATLRVADFDADGRDDVLLLDAASASFLPSSAYFFDATGQVASTVQLPNAWSAAVGDITADGLDDVLLGGDTLLSFRSLATRKFSPLLGATRAVAGGSQLFSADLDCDRQRDILVVEGATLSRARSVTDLEWLLDLETELEPETSSAVAKLVRPGVGTCEVLALVPPLADRVDIYGRGAPVAEEPARIVKLSSVTLPSAPLQRLLFFDMNGDARDDLVLQLQSVAGETDLHAAAYGVADGTFHSNPASIPASGGDGLTSPVDLGTRQEILLAAQLDDDPEVDFFYTQAQVAGPTYASYEAALALDLTGDGLNDVAAGTWEAIDLYRSAPSGVSSRLSLEVPGASSLRDAADFDGDGFRDLLVTSARAEDGVPRTLSVLFAPLASGSTPRLQELAELPGIEAAVAGYLRDQADYLDGNADLGVLHGDGRSIELGLLHGGPDRLLRSPLAGDGLSSSVKTPILGHFRERGTRDLLVLRDTLGETGLTVELLAFEATRPVSLASAKHEAVRPEGDVLALDLDGDGVDELYYMRPERGEGPGVGIPDLLLAQLKPSFTEEPPRLELAYDPDFWDEKVVALATADVNGDGARDLCVRLDGAFVVRLAVSDASPEGGQYEVRMPADCAPLAQAWIQADTDPPLELALNCFTFELGDGSETFLLPSPTLRVYDASWESRTLRLLSEQPSVNGGALEVGDFNGDGVPDLATGLGDATVLLGVPR